MQVIPYLKKHRELCPALVSQRNVAGLGRLCALRCYTIGQGSQAKRSVLCSFSLFMLSFPFMGNVYSLELRVSFCQKLGFQVCWEDGDQNGENVYLDWGQCRCGGIPQSWNFFMILSSQYDEMSEVLLLKQHLKEVSWFKILLSSPLTSFLFPCAFFSSFSSYFSSSTSFFSPLRSYFNLFSIKF